MNQILNTGSNNNMQGRQTETLLNGYNNKNNKKEKNKNKNSMNMQIKRSSGPASISSVTKFFAVAIIIFGIFMIGTGSYSMYKNVSSQNAAQPTINVIQASAGELSIQINSNKALSKITYNWNNDSATEIQTNGRNSIEQNIAIPSGTNTLNIYVSDENGQEARYQQQYTAQGNINIQFESQTDGTVKVMVDAQEQLAYMTYRWDDEEEQRVDINDTSIEQDIQVPSTGMHTLTVNVVDQNNRTETKQQEVQGTVVPEVEVTTDGSSHFIIHAKDETGLAEVRFIINETGKYKLELDGRTDFEYQYELEPGENRLEVIVYNQDGQSTTKKVKVNMPEQ